MIINGILIDVSREPGCVRPLSIDEDNLNEFYDALHCSCIDIVTRKIGGLVYDITCDDEGLLKDNCVVTAWSKDNKPMLVGNLFISKKNGTHLASLNVHDALHILDNIAGYQYGDATGTSHKAMGLINVEYV